MRFNAWDSLRDMEAIRRQVQRVFDQWETGRWDLPFSRSSFLPGRAARAYPLVNVSEDDEKYSVQALAPGVDPTKLKLSVVGDSLVIEGEKLSGAGNVRPEWYHRCERSASQFVRQIQLPTEVDATKVKAEYRSGLLTVTLPKSEAARPRQISVKVG